MEADHVGLMKDRKYEMIPLDRIKVLNSRKRGKAHFKEIVRSIDEVGLLVPIVVNERYLEKKGYYDLICGEGRLLAFKQQGRTHIRAQVRNCTKKEALILSLVENIARVPPGTMWFAHEVKRMHDAGWNYEQIGRIVGRSGTYVRDYINLVERGEARLIKGVEQGLFPISFAVKVSGSSNSTIQNVLIDAFDNGIVSTSNLSVVRRIIELRMKVGKDQDHHTGKTGAHPPEYSVKQLKSDISRITKKKEAFVQEAEVKENRLLALLDGLNTLWQDKKLVALLKERHLDRRPELKGQYNV